MANILEVSRKKLAEIQRVFIINGIIMLILSVLIVWTDAVLKLLVGIFILLISYSLFYVAYKVHTIRKIID